jgi:hypothetical protein
MSRSYRIEEVLEQKRDEQVTCFDILEAKEEAACVRERGFFFTEPQTNGRDFNCANFHRYFSHSFSHIAA